MNYIGFGRYEEVETIVPTMPGFVPEDDIVIITSSGRMQGELYQASPVGISFTTADKDFRFVPWTAIRAVRLIREGAGEKA